MGIGCNAVGVTGCRIIDSKRERLIAMLTNSLMPCNGRFPTLIAMITLFLASGVSRCRTLLSAAMLLGMISVSIFATLAVSWVLSKTILRGAPSSFTLELPPYRPPEVGRVIVRSVLDRTLFVLGRAVAVAAPAGLILWVLANLSLGGQSFLLMLAHTLDPIGRVFGMDGAILLAFILALPANEIAIPIVLMIYTGGGALVEYSSLEALGELLCANGWSITTALCVAVFTLFHFPCSTTLLTIKKESGKWRWAILGALLPTVLGLAICFLIALF